MQARNQCFCLLRIFDRRHLLDVGASAESFCPGARKHDCAQVLVACERDQSRGKRVHDRAAHHVQAATVVDREISNHALGAFIAPGMRCWIVRVRQPRFLQRWIDNGLTVKL
jgi:hypothetical protein